MVGGRHSIGGRSPADEQRHYLVNEAIYDMDEFGFAIDHARDLLGRDVRYRGEPQRMLAPAGTAKPMVGAEAGR